MEHINIEIKASCSDPEKIRAILKEKGADFKGTDHQIDTYFHSRGGRLKLREGKIENNLIHYYRSNEEGPKLSEVSLFKSEPGSGLKDILVKSMGVMIVIDKMREIYFINNVKFHLDQVQDLGSFLEIEAINEPGDMDQSKLEVQCDQYLQLFEIESKDLIAVSYSDLLMEKNKS